jgi:hypothetical protein
MRFEFPTANNHTMNADGGDRAEHCCGCWHYVVDENDPQRPYAQCNECREIRVATFPGIDPEG